MNAFVTHTSIDIGESKLCVKLKDTRLGYHGLYGQQKDGAVV